MLTDRAAAADSPRMDPVVLSAFLLAEAAAVTSLLLLRRSRRRASAASVQPAPSAVPDPPVVEALSPAFITTNSGRRYHLGCLTGDGGLRYAVWTARSHELVRLFDCTEAGCERRGICSSGSSAIAARNGSTSGAPAAHGASG